MSNRDLCLNDPINFVDPYGLQDMYSGYAHFYPHYNTINHHPTSNMTDGQVTAIVKDSVGISGIVGGAITGQPEIIAIGIVVLADGTVLTISELLGGDTSSIPSDYEIWGDILQGFIDNWPEEPTPCP